MSGSIRGRVECRHWVLSGLSTDHKVMAQEIFVNLYNTFKVHPNMTEIARNGGSGGSALSLNYWDQANPFGNNAWFVFRMNTATENPAYLGTRTFPWYILVQWNRYDQGVFGASPGNPGLVNGVTFVSAADAHVTVQFAIGVGGDQNPWNGSGTLGTNTKGTPVWKVPTGGTDVLVWPRSNSSGGDHSTSRENCAAIYFRGANTVVGTHANFLLDDDSFLFLWSPESDAYSASYFGPYTPAPSLNPTYPYVMLSTGGAGTMPFVTTNVCGNVAGTGYTPAAYPGGNTGGIADVAGKVVGTYIDRYSLLDGSYLRNPNRQFSPAAFSEFPLAVYAYELPDDTGYLGQVDFIREVSGLSSYVRNSSGNRAVFGGSSTTTAVKLSIPWPVGVTPLSGYTRTGISF